MAQGAGFGRSGDTAQFRMVLKAAAEIRDGFVRHTLYASPDCRERNSLSVSVRAAAFLLAGWAGQRPRLARISTDTQTVENQIRELKQIAVRRGWEVVEVYTDAGISGAKSRAQRPGLDSDAERCKSQEFRCCDGMGN
jgi:resolvase-like protein